MDCSDNRGDTALARRLYLHLQSGGNITAGDMGRMVEALERRDAAIAPIRRHAQSHDLGAPLRFSVAESREIMRKVDNG